MIDLHQEERKVKIKKGTQKHAYPLYEGRELILNVFRSGVFPIKEICGQGLKISTPNQVVQRIPIALTQVKIDKTFENLLNEIRQIINSLYRAKETTKNLYNNIMNLTQV